MPARLILLSLLALLVVACQPGDTTTEGDVMDGSLDRSELRVKPKWYTVSTVEGNGSKQSEPFRINTDGDWKIRWRTTPGAQGTDEFVIILYDKNDEFINEIIANVAGQDEDFAYLEGKGEYFIEIKSSQEYQVVVEEQR